MRDTKTFRSLGERWIVQSNLLGGLPSLAAETRDAVDQVLRLMLAN